MSHDRPATTTTAAVASAAIEELLSRCEGRAREYEESARLYEAWLPDESAHYRLLAQMQRNRIGYLLGRSHSQLRTFSSAARLEISAGGQLQVRPTQTRLRRPLLTLTVLARRDSAR